MNYKDLWPLIQNDVLGVLSAHEFIGTRKGVAVEPGDVEAALDAKVQAALGPGTDGKVGIGFLVLPIEKAIDDNVSVPGGPLKLSITIQFVENVTINRGPRGTGLPCRIWTAIAEKTLKLYTPVGLTQNLVPASPVIYEFTPERDANLRVGQVEFTALEADFRPYLKINRPRIAVAGDVASPSDNNYTINSGAAVVTVTAPDAEQIYYTVNGTHPYAGNPEAALYSAPLNITEECLFRARGFAKGKHGSDTAAANFSPPDS